MAKYGKKTQEHVEDTMHRMKKGNLKSGKKGKGGTVKSRKQAIAIALSESREKGYKVPVKKKSAKKSAAKKSTKKSASSKKSTAKKSTATRKRTGSGSTRSRAAKKGAKKSTRKKTAGRKKSAKKR
jgi:hypothetical protein